MIQIDMPMPKTCHDCPFYVMSADAYGIFLECAIIIGASKEDGSCPLREVEDGTGA